MPLRSANSGEARGARGSDPARYNPAACRMPLGVNIAQLRALATSERAVLARSHHVEHATRAAGGGRPGVRIAAAVAMARQAPAESPAITILELGCVATSQRYASVASSTAAGNGYSGASR